MNTAPLAGVLFILLILGLAQFAAWIIHSRKGRK